MRTFRFGLLAAVLMLLMFAGAAWGQNNGTYSSGTPNYTSAATGFTSALQLDGTHYVNLPVAAWPTTLSFSVSCRIKTSSSALGVVFGVGANGTGAAQFWFGVSGGHLDVCPRGTQVTGTTIINDNAWHTILVKSTLGTVTAYIDGTQETLTGLLSYTAGTGAGVAIGNAPNIGAYAFNGVVDEVAIFNSAIASAAPASPWSSNAPGITGLYHLDSALSDSATLSLTAAPYAVPMGATGNVITVVGVGTAFSGSPFALAGSGGIGTAAPSGSAITAQTVTDTTHASVTITASTAAATITLYDTGSLAQVLLVSYAPLFASGAQTNATGATTATVQNITIGGGVVPYTYQWYRSLTSNFTPGVGVLVAGANALILADTGLTPATPYFYKLGVTDAIGNTATSNQTSVYTYTNVTPLKIGFIGDSITSGTGPTDGTMIPPVAMCVRLQQENTFRVITIPTNVVGALTLNQGIAGTTSADWAHGAGTNYLSTVLTRFSNIGGITWVVVSLGVNDAKDTVATSKASYKSNLAGLCADIVAAGYKVCLNGPTFSTSTTAAGYALVQQYQSALSELVDNATIFAGAIYTPFQYFAQNPGELSDGTHPTNQGGNSLGQMWERAFAKAAGLSASSASTISRRFIH